MFSLALAEEIIIDGLLAILAPPGYRVKLQVFFSNIYAFKYI